MSKRRHKKKTNGRTFSFSEEDKIYGPDDIIYVLGERVDPDWVVRKRGGKVRPNYYNIPCAFDIETSSFLNDAGEKTAIMYIWQFGINGAVIVGRTWEEFFTMLHKVEKALELSSDKRLIIYVHNLAYEFQFMKDWIKDEIESVFALAPRKPVKVVLKTGIEFRCSYILSGYSLALVGKNLLKYKVQKKTGDLDYTLIRHSATPLTEEELRYCVNDILVVMAYIQEKIEADGNITKICLTKTGYVRKLCRNACYKDDFKGYRKLMYNLQLSPEEYLMCKDAFAGGFTHASAMNCGKTFSDVGSIDFTSSYPAELVKRDGFPMNKGRKVYPKTVEELHKYLSLYCCIFRIRLEGVCAKYMIENPISKSRCSKVVGAVVDNGRIFSAEILEMTITEVDYRIFRAFYTWERQSFGTMYIYEKGYLPTPFVRTVLDLYAAKTELKGVEGMEAEYLSGKESVNSLYGMLVTDIVRDEHIYHDGEWERQPADLADCIEKYNSSISRFTFYPWGIYVTAYARYDLFTGIMACIKSGEANYIYSDTDSLKVQHIEHIQNYIELYNHNCINDMVRACEHHGFPSEMVKPKTVKGVEKPLGVWDYEGIYSHFKTLGAKRYMTEHEGALSITVSGVNKHVAVPWMKETFGDAASCFEAFNDGLIFPEEATGKNTHTYIDDPRDGVVMDYMRNLAEYHEKSGVHLSGAEYHLGLSQEYINYLKGFQEVLR